MSKFIGALLYQKLSLALLLLLSDSSLSLSLEQTMLEFVRSSFTPPLWQFCCLSTAIPTLDNKFDVWNCLLCSCCNKYAVKTSLPRPRSFNQPSLEYAILAKSLNVTYVAIETIVHVQNQFDSRGQLIHTQLGHMHRSSPNVATRLAWQNIPNAII